MFREDAKRFYRELGKKTIKFQKPPDIGEVKRFWQNILEQEISHHEDAQWIKDQQEELKDINQMEWKDFTVEKLRVNITRAANWKSPGPDKLPNFWIKQFTSLHTPMAKAYSQIMQDPSLTPEWLVEGTTNLLPKKEETWIPKNYRPIACLPTTFKIVTSVITDRLYNHLEKESIMTSEQRGGKKNCYGCKDQLMINSVILENCKKRKKNLSTAWIDYKKAFDSVPHSWILACFRMYKINPVLTTFIEASMRQWKTNMVLVHENGVLETGPISIKGGMLAKKADVDRIYLPCQEGGRSLMNLEKEYKATMVGLHKYMINKEDSQIQAVLRHHSGKAHHSIPKEAEAYLTEAGTKDLITNDLPKSATWKAKKLKLKYKEDVNKLVKDRWKEKAMHGKLPKYLEKDHVDQEMSFQWMKYTGLKGETEGLITAAQDQALNTRYYSKHIIKQGSTDRCRMCHTQAETVEHIISGCQTLAADKYLNRHNQVAAQLHLDICKHYAIKVDAQHWYQHNPERVMENEKATILWDHQVKTDRHIPCNKPDIIIQEKDSEKCLIIDVAIPSDYNIQKKATEKMSKYVDLQIECQRMWNKKVEVIPIVIGATGIVEKGIQSYLQKIPGKHNLYNLQRSAILGTAHILRKVLSIKPD